MKKFIIKIVVFIVIFSLCFLGLQNIMHHRWSDEEEVYTRYLDYSYAEKDSIDVLALGTSELLADYDPIIAYEECGFTGYNFATSYRAAMPLYFQLMYALKYQTPDVVICDFSCLFEDKLPSEDDRLYRKVVDSIPDKRIKESMIKEICLADSEQSALSWEFPMLRYHSMWSELDESNFKPDHIYDDTYPVYKKGALLHAITPFSGEKYEITSTLWDYSFKETRLSEVSIKYYDMLINECKNRDIEVVAVIPPKIMDASLAAARWDAMQEFFESRGVGYLNYNTYDQVKRLDVNFDDDYYDACHLNIDGSIKFSRVLAKDIDDLYGLADHRKDVRYSAEWEEALDLFWKDYPLIKEVIK